MDTRIGETFPSPPEGWPDGLERLIPAINIVVSTGVASTVQPLPQQNDRACIQDLVIADIEERKKIGKAKYGTLLQPFNGRDALVDAYQEALDLCQYLRQEIEERNAKAASAAAGDDSRVRVEPAPADHPDAAEN